MSMNNHIGIQIPARNTIGKQKFFRDQVSHLTCKLHIKNLILEKVKNNFELITQYKIESVEV